MIGEWEAARPRVMAAALHVIGERAEAEDVVQETWLRWERTDRAAVVHPHAFLAVTAVRLAINVKQSARWRYETYVMTEAVERGPGPETLAERHQAVDSALRLLLERLTPAERAAYLLRKAFDYSYRRISHVLGLGEDHARQLVRRGHQALTGKRRQPVDPNEHRRLVRAFRAAAEGELAGLERCLESEPGRGPEPGLRR
ncbi:sigma factor [Paractinoplanes atraurantiacus]|uniref:RNA polymerase sigma-70 factor, ECF subfamily n=1 Tax=Paractinoplanes atraurantiacus TaxID=1036182 RepID=A0A285K9F2_9ACTN|nr:sigma factor [Actinoplanes atraurantiacus]SNY69254.1 RNA polymerase sigma-70 factor, ECF subfamily [Actinoplanes atraurantiacus]